MYGNLCYQPARDFGFLREAMDNLFSGVSGTVHEFPPVNVWTNENGAVVRAELPGVDSANIDISVVNDTLTLKGKRPGEELNEGDRLLRRERLRGEFARALSLPFKVDANAVAAKFDNGVLTINLPRAESDKPRKIAIKTA